jgi:hypothetical protein
MNRHSRSVFFFNCAFAVSAAFTAAAGAQTVAPPAANPVAAGSTAAAPARAATTTTAPGVMTAPTVLAPPALPMDLIDAENIVKGLSAVGWQETGVEHVVQDRKTLVFKGQALSESALASVPPPVVTNAFNQRDALLEFGCTDILIKQLQRGQRNIDVVVYRFGGSQGAYGAYTNLRQGATNVIVRGDRSSEDDSTVSFQRGNYFIRIASDAHGDDEAKEAITALADSIANRIAPQAALPPVMYKLPTIDRVTGSERLFMGGMTARRHTTVPYIGQLNLESARASAYADYQFSPPLSERMKLLIVEYQEPETAQEIFNRYVGTLGDVHRVLTTDASTALFKVSDNFLYCQRNGKDIVVISGARKRISPLMLARQLGIM